MKKRLLAMMMAFVMAVSLLPMSALAVDAGGETPEPSAPANAEGLEVSKIATANDGTYTLTMEAYTTGEVRTITSSRPTDIVLVLDMSGSMNNSYTTYTDTYQEVLGDQYQYWKNKKTGYGFNKKLDKGDHSNYYIKIGDGTYQQLKYYGRDKNGYEVFYYTTGSWFSTQYYWYYPELKKLDNAPDREHDYAVVQFYEKSTISQPVNKFESLKNAVNSFIDQTAAQNKDVEENNQHRISIVKFAGQEEKLTEGNDTYILNGNTYNYSQIVKGLTYVTSETAAGLKEKVKKLEPNGSTAVDSGLNRATAALKESNETRNKVVIVFTDGEPNYLNGFDSNVANAAIEKAKSLKDSGVKVYSVCIDKNAKVGTSLDGETANINRFMHLLSSNYPNATSMKEGDEGTGGSVSNGYYKVPSNNMSLAGIFEKISQDIATPGISLGTSAKLVDTVTQYFSVISEEIVVKAVPCTGVNNEGSYTWDDDNAEILKIIPTVNSNEDGTTTISVTGFDYDENFVSETARKVKGSDFYGKKLVVEVKVTPKEGFWGGNNVPTNAGTSGIYDKDEKIVEAFPVPQVNVPLRVPDLKGKNVNIYCGNTAPAITDLVDQDGAFITDQGTWKTDFVIVGNVALKDGSGPISNVEDGNYTFGATVTPKCEATTNVGVAIDMSGVDKQASGSVNVFKPTITFQDTTINKGNIADYSENLVNTVWKHGTGETATTDTGVTMLGTSPDLTLTYNPVAAQFDKDQNVAVTEVKNGTTDIKAHTDFAWQLNSNSSQCTDCKEAPKDNHFRVHVVDTTPPFGEGITIQKEANQKAPLPGETVTYTITLTNSGAEEKTVTVVDELPFGLEDAVVTDFTSDSNVTYDKKTGTITWTNVSVPGKTDDKNGTVKLTYDVTIPNSAEPGTIYNNNVKIVNGTYESQRDTETITVAATVAIEGMKVVEQKGNVTPPADAKFTFSLKLVKTGGTDVENGDTYTVTSGAGDFSFQPIRYTEAGTYVYEVTETIGTDTNWTYDKTKYTVTVIVSSDKESNKLLAPELVYSVGDTKADKMTFTNTYTKNKSTGGGGGSSKPPVLNKEDHYAYIVGYPDGTVKPQGNITRAEVATIFFRMLTDDSRNEFWSQTNSYSDVSEGQWFNNAISTLANAGILSGYPDGTFRPNAPITRAEFTKIAASFFERVEYTIDNPFNDVDDDDWFYKFVMAAYEGGLITGYPEGDFRPNANISRAESVTIVNRTLERAPDADHFLKDMIVWPDNAENAWYYEAVQEATNSHEYVVKGTGTNKYEEWTKILEVRDWPALEKDWSNANSATGGEVVK